MKDLTAGTYKEPAVVAPFLKWAGGKRWLVANHKSIFPQFFKTYFEPFLGSAAVFFYLAPNQAVLSDANKDLIEAYWVIKDNWQRLEKALMRHQRLHSNEYYYEMRDARPRTSVARAARFLYLNRTCWNGLYRVNLNGTFNVPIGTKSAVVLSSDNFEEVSARLKNAKLYVCDFEKTIDRAEAGDFVFVDVNMIAKEIADYIYDKLVAIYGTERTPGGDDAYWERGIANAKAKSDAYTTRAKEAPEKRLHIFAYLHLLDLRDIVRQPNNWDHFEAVFNIPLPDEQKGKKYYLQWMEDFNELRRIPGHPSKHRPYREADYEFIEWLKREFSGRLRKAKLTAHMP